MSLVMSRNKIIINNVLQYTAIFIAALLAFGLVIDLLKRDLHIPFSYRDDVIFMINWVKTVLETGWYFSNPNLSMPGTFSLTNFPLAEGFNAIVINFFGLFSSNSVLIFNTLYILSYPFVACTALFTFKYLGLRFPFAFAASLLYALQPYHFIRSVDHIFLSLYYMIPLAIWLGFWITENDIFRNEENSVTVHGRRLHHSVASRFLLVLFLCFCIGSTLVYYSFFSCIFILLLGSLTAYSRKQWFPLKNAIIAISLISIALAANIWPFLKYVLKNGGMAETAHRHFFEAEYFGLKLYMILMPSHQHRLHFLKNFSDAHLAHPLAAMGEMWQYMGIFAVIGFLALLIIAILPKRHEDRLYFISKLNICGVLLGVMGGFGIMVADFLSPMIRCYNRIVIFLALFSLYAFFWLLQGLLSKTFFSKWPKLLWLLLIILISTGIYEQTSPEFKKYFAAKEDFENDRVFVQGIEAKMSKGSKILQLPYDCFPECTPPGKMAPYDHLKLYLHSHHLRWSYGAMKGTPTAALHCKLASKKAQDLISEAIALDFSGISINRKGYDDEGKSLEADLIKILGQMPLVSQDGILSFFDLRGYQE